MIYLDLILVVSLQGSVGSSVDLVPLAHVVLVIVSEGKQVFLGTTIPGKEALIKAGLKPVTLKTKEEYVFVNNRTKIQKILTINHFSGIILVKKQYRSDGSSESIIA